MAGVWHAPLPPYASAFPNCILTQSQACALVHVLISRAVACPPLSGSPMAQSRIRCRTLNFNLPIANKRQKRKSCSTGRRRFAKLNIDAGSSKWTVGIEMITSFARRHMWFSTAHCPLGPGHQPCNNGARRPQPARLWTGHVGARPYQARQHIEVATRAARVALTSCTQRTGIASQMRVCLRIILKCGVYETSQSSRIWRLYTKQSAR